jgi:translation elongation factor P/translation initiation factor 5A
VKDVYRREVPIAPERTAQQIRKSIDEEYFGDNETYDDNLLKEEKLEEEAKR